LPRAAQLTQRTNQFNCTTKRRSERNFATGSSEAAAEFSVSDRFGRLRLVGLVLFQFEKDVIAVENFSTDCRALGRGVEHRMLARVGELAKSRGAAYGRAFCSFRRRTNRRSIFSRSVATISAGAHAATFFDFQPSSPPRIKLARSTRRLIAGIDATNETKAQTSARSTFNRGRWIALEANEAGKNQQALIEAKAGVRKNSRRILPRQNRVEANCAPLAGIAAQRTHRHSRQFF